MKSLKNNKIVVVFGGRFQPFHAGHQQVYDHLCEKFGDKNVWITTSNKQSKESPLTFKQKQHVACDFFEIPKSRFVQCQVPYVPTELLEKLPDKNFSLILVLGKKDKDRFVNNEYFTNLPKNINNLDIAENKAYIYSVPMYADGTNATQIRKKFQSNIDKQKKKELFLKLFGGFDQGIFNTLTKSNS